MVKYFLVPAVCKIVKNYSYILKMVKKKNPLNFSIIKEKNKNKKQQCFK
jgi:hypothetical protein